MTTKDMNVSYRLRSLACYFHCVLLFLSFTSLSLVLLMSNWSNFSIILSEFYILSNYLFCCTWVMRWIDECQEINICKISHSSCIFVDSTGQTKNLSLPFNFPCTRIKSRVVRIERSMLRYLTKIAWSSDKTHIKKKESMKLRLRI